MNKLAKCKIQGIRQARMCESCFARSNLKILKGKGLREKCSVRKKARNLGMDEKMVGH